MGITTFELVKRNTQEIVEENELKDLLLEKPHPTAYIGYATTGMLHIGHFLPILKVKDFLKRFLHLSDQYLTLHF